MIPDLESTKDRPNSSIKCHKRMGSTQIRDHPFDFLVKLQRGHAQHRLSTRQSLRPQTINKRFMIHLQGCNTSGTALRLAKDLAENSANERVLNLQCKDTYVKRAIFLASRNNIPEIIAGNLDSGGIPNWRLRSNWNRRLEFCVLYIAHPRGPRILNVEQNLVWNKRNCEQVDTCWVSMATHGVQRYCLY